MAPVTINVCGILFVINFGEHGLLEAIILLYVLLLLLFYKLHANNCTTCLCIFFHYAFCLLIFLSSLMITELLK